MMSTISKRDLRLGRNLKDNGTTKWVELKLDLTPVELSKEPDSLTWLPSVDDVFSTNFFMMDIGKKVEVIDLTLVETVWKGNHLKR